MDKKTLNLNVGVLGHVDSGKTSLAKVLSTTASTACFDKNPQSQERGITIDLGFSSMALDMPEHLKKTSGREKLQFTFVDCPGHASLIRTIIGGAQIIDMMILVVDVTKGMQTQTAECLVIGELTCNRMIVVLNKIDLLPADKRDSLLQKVSKKMANTLSSTVFKDCPIVGVAARPGGVEDTSSKPEGITDLVTALQQTAFLPKRDMTLPFLFAVDHCFSVRGQGTVLTGTVLQGSIKINDTVEIPALKMTRKVKSLQMFREPVHSGGPGDRLGVCVTQFDPKQVERGLLCAPGHVPAILAAVISVEKIKYFKGAVATKARFHVSLGHETVMARLTVFGLMAGDGRQGGGGSSLDLGQVYRYLPHVLRREDDVEQDIPLRQFALLQFERPVLAVPECLVIGSKLDIDVHAPTCRLAFHGRLLRGYQDKHYVSTELPKLKVYREKCRQGLVERAHSCTVVVVKNLFKKETNIQVFIGMNVSLSTGEPGVIEGAFGQSGKVKISVPEGLEATTVSRLTNPSNKKKGKDDNAVKVTLQFRRFIFDPLKKMFQ